MMWWSICRAICRRSIRSRFAPWSAALAESGADIATLARRNHRSRRARQSRRGQSRGGLGARTAGWAARSISPARPRRPAKARCFIMSGIYAYRRDALARFVALPPSPLETAREAGTAARPGSGYEHCGGARGQRAAQSSILRPISPKPISFLHGNFHMIQVDRPCQTRRLPGRAGRLCQSGGARGDAACRRRSPSPASRMRSRR